MSRLIRLSHFSSSEMFHVCSFSSRVNSVKTKFIWPTQYYNQRWKLQTMQHISRMPFSSWHGIQVHQFQLLQKTCNMSTATLVNDMEEALNTNMALAERLKNHAFGDSSDDHVPDKSQLNKEERQKMILHRQLLPVAQNVQSILEEMQELKEIIQCQESETTIETELVEMARQDLTTSLVSLKEYLKDAAALLLPDHAFDAKSAVLEVLAGVGGNEASLFAEEIFNLYVGYSKEHFDVEVTSVEKLDAGEGIHKATAIVKGLGAFHFLKYECGVHRVQRVPKASTGNKSDRLQTSTCSVAVLPVPDDAEYQVPEKELKIEFVKSSGPGGQNVNKLDTCCRITHIPTGIAVKCQEQRTQHQNKAKALQQVINCKLRNSQCFKIER